ncbi:class I SAM-dependent methyltransferase [Bacteroidota bacterium]
MPTLEQNIKFWGEDYNWKKTGTEWSKAWGGADIQWYGSLLPRIINFLPAHHILEIAPGYGRWTNYLKDSCEHLSIVDLNQNCISACKERFADSTNISYYLNDGRSLDMFEDDSIDFVFSFDSLVHADESVLESYVSQISRKLKMGGIAFLHHSNLGNYSNYIKLEKFVRKIPKFRGLLFYLGIIDNISQQWRDKSMTAQKMQIFCDRSKLYCAGQELITWNSRRVLIDCISLIEKNRSDSNGTKTRIFNNPRFMKEAKYLGQLNEVYSAIDRKEQI